ncbi:MAG: hypothetical protein NZ805_04930 [Armatimonadetes bacterium]|nr:hypothetical protein [Armatimonadota bacterium]MDW8029716.1 hypothetical protein [Armatimonadota bacterium]
MAITKIVGIDKICAKQKFRLAISFGQFGNFKKAIVYTERLRQLFGRQQFGTDYRSLEQTIVDKTCYCRQHFALLFASA